ncbi:MAG: cation:proton antiporter [Kiritimatiellae bacterium]|nr:cation:proton antiporter [Kiritimatiellia bacterium]
MNEGAFFKDLAVIMAVAGGMSLVFARLKWPKVFGCILAGILMSGHTFGGGLLVEESSVQTIGQLGIVFLMFSMGLEFSTSEMKKIRSVVIPVAIIDILLMTGIGYTVGRNLFGWSSIPSLFLGVAICDSATTLLAKIIGELGWNRKPFVKYVMGASVCEDIVCVGAIALVTGFATGHVSFAAAARSLGGLGVFFLVTLVVGFVIVPRLLKSIMKRCDDEVLLLTMLGCCFLVSWIAWQFEFSLALGAFLVGIVGSTSEARYKLGKLFEPLKAMFAAVFFVSVGLLVDPSQWLANRWEILLLTLVVVLGKFFNCTLGALLAGEDFKSSVQIGLSLAQIGEFAFMVAMLYVTLTHDTGTPMYQIVVAVSIFSTLLNPLLIRISDTAGEWLAAKRPKRLEAAMEGYRALVMRFKANSGRPSAAMRVVRANATVIALIAILNFAVAFVCSLMNGRIWGRPAGFFNCHKGFFFSLIVNLFMVAGLAPSVKSAAHLGDAFARVLAGGREAAWMQPLRGTVRLFAVVSAGAFWFLQLSVVNANLHPEETWAQFLILGLMILAAVLGWRFFLKSAVRAGKRLTEAMNADERLRNFTHEVPDNPLVLTVPAENVHQIMVPDLSPAIGLSVAQLGIRAKTGANIIRVNRDGKLHRNTGPDWVFRAGDLVVAYGDGSQIAALKDLFGVVS